MKKLLLLLLLIINIGCATPQVISTSPDAFHPQRVTTDKELIIEWQQSLIKIKEWQVWYDIQVGSNYFNCAKAHTLYSVTLCQFHCTE